MSYTAPLCRGHHREVHRCGDEAAWWRNFGIDRAVAARARWLETYSVTSFSNNVPDDAAGTPVDGQPLV